MGKQFTLPALNTPNTDELELRGSKNLHLSFWSLCLLVSVSILCTKIASPDVSLFHSEIRCMMKQQSSDFPDILLASLLATFAPPRK